MSDLKKLLPYVKPYVGVLVIVFLLGLLMSLADTSIAMIVKPIFDEVFEKKQSDKQLVLSLAVVGIILFHGIARYFHLYMLKMVIEKITVRLRQDLQAKYMELRLSYHSDTNPGALLSKITNDVSSIADGLRRMADIAKEPITLLALVIWMCYLDVKLTLAILIAVPIIFKILRVFAKSARKYTSKQMVALEDVTHTFKETLDGLRVIQSFNLQNEMKTRLDKVSDLYLKLRSKVISREEAAGPITEFIGSITFAGVLFYSGGQIIKGASSLGDFMSYAAALAILQMPIKKIQEAFVRLQGAVVCTRRIFDILENTSTVPQKENPKSFPMDWNEIQFKNVSFSYDSAPVIKNINLTVKRGEVIALVGESGCGKSTLMNLLERFYDPTGGQILIGNSNIQDLRVQDLRANIALVTQDVFLFNDTIERNIQSGNFDKETFDVRTAASLANANIFIDKTPEKFQTLAGDRGTRLSGGEKQRISIARAIYKDAPILILDEATSALDSVSEQEVQEGLDQLMKGRTVFVIAHRLSTIANADRICVLKDGQIVEEGTHSSLMDDRGLYFQFHQIQH